MNTALWILVVGFLLVDGWLNFNERPSLATALFSGKPAAARRYGGLTVYGLVIAALIYLGWSSP